VTRVTTLPCWVGRRGASTVRAVAARGVGDHDDLLNDAGHLPVSGNARGRLLAPHENQRLVDICCLKGQSFALTALR
jgi:hypothetical protein